MVCATVIFSRVLAQSPDRSPSTGLSVSPPTFELSGNPGEILKNSIKLENMNTHPVEIAVDLRNFSAIGEEGAVDITENEGTHSLSTWIDVFPKTVVIPGKTAQYFNFTLKIPLNAEPGGHFGSLIFRTIPTEKLEGSGASLAQEIGALILLKVAGQSIESAQIESFESGKALYEYGPVDFVARIKNLGNVHTKPYGTISITNALGKNVATIQLDKKNILPGAIRKLEGTWDTKWRMGYYTATFIAVFSDNTQQAAVTSFTILPYRLVGIIILVLIVLILILVLVVVVFIFHFFLLLLFFLCTLPTPGHLL